MIRTAIPALRAGNAFDAGDAVVVMMRSGCGGMRVDDFRREAVTQQSGREPGIRRWLRGRAGRCRPTAQAVAPSPIVVGDDEQAGARLDGVGGGFSARCELAGGNRCLRS